MKFRCPYCNEEIEITQSERAKHGDKKFDAHKAECFKAKHGDMISFMNQGCREVCYPDDVISDEGGNIDNIIRRLHIQLGRIPMASEIMVEMIHIRAMKEALRS